METKYSSYYINTLFDAFTVKLILKWAGGKSQLIKKISEYLPREMCNGRIKKYAEPFFGGGALFFHIIQNYPNIENYYISDINEELILIYKTIQIDVEELISSLEKIEFLYKSLDTEDQKTYFYEIRSDLNRNKSNFNYSDFNECWVKRTAKLIFLNKTCFNGLFRVNSKGEFNVPFGRYKNPTICDIENLIGASRLMKNVQIKCDDFTQSSNFIDDKTFVYFDPPYRPISRTSGFTSYSKNSFDDREQIRLAEYYRELHKVGSKLLLSNSDPKNIKPEDDFFDRLYQGFNIDRINAKRMINCDASKRGDIKEVIIKNY